MRREEFKKQARGQMVYVYDPAAPPANTKNLPIAYHHLPCTPDPSPPAPPAAPPATPTAGPPPPPPATGSASGDAPKPTKKPAGGQGQENEAPPDLPKPIVYPKNDPDPRPQPPRNGVTTHWPKTVLPIRRAQVDTHTSVLPMAHVLPVRREQVDTHTLVLPRTHVLPFKHEVKEPGQGGKGDGGKGDAPIKVAAKTVGDKAAEQLIFGGAIASGELNHDIQRPDGKQYGMPGGKNAEGPNNPAAQASAGVVLVVAAVLSAGGRTFYKKLAKALKDGKPLAYSEMQNVADDVADELANKLGEHFKKQLGTDAVNKTRIALAASLNQNGAIGPYSKMTQFTDKLGGSYQAHHILEVKMMKDFRLGNPDLGPSVILAEAEHKAVTAKLKIETANVRNVQELWKAYQKVYTDYPHWLKAIEPYFAKSK